MTQVDTRSELLGLLSDACEVEHAVACAYLHAAMSIQTEALDEGLDWQDQQRARRWAAQIDFVATQEMLHLAQAWNLLVAIGGSPWLSPAPFDQPLPALDGGRLRLLPFGGEALRAFVELEKKPPEEPAPEAPVDRPRERRVPYSSVGELYALIEEGVRNIPDPALFVGADDAQLTPRAAHFPDLLPVRNRGDALSAIHRIRAQGEGTSSTDTDCHHGIFQAILDELDGRDEARFLRARTASLPSAVSALFDDAYSISMRLMAWACEYGGRDEARGRVFARASIELMTGVVRPLGIACFQVVNERGDVGPRFRLGRVVPLPPSAATAARLGEERLRGLACDAEALTNESTSVGGLGATLRRLASLLESSA